MLARSTLALLAFAALAVPNFMGCAAELDDDAYDEEVENEPQGETNSEARSSVACQERTERAYRSGQAFNIQVITIGGKLIAKPAGHAFLRMQAAAHAAGVDLTLSSGFRTMAEQEYFYNCYRTRRCNNGNLAARPGYSNHQSGTALDLTRSTWLSQNARRFGFVATVRSEPWHYEFQGTDPGGPCSRDGSTARDTSEGEATPGALQWVAPSQGSTLSNGFVVKSRASSTNIVRVTYSQGTLTFGESTARANDFALNYRFRYLGQKTLTARGYDASGRLVATDHVDFTLNP